MGAVTHHRIVVIRDSGDEATVAVVEWDGIDSSRFKSNLTAALTKWAKTTEEGRDAWDESSQDFNVGDLSNADYEDNPLKAILAEFGIKNLSVSVYSDDDSPTWGYDDVLIDGDAIAAADDDEQDD